MKKLIKVILICLAAILSLLLVAIIALPFIIDPNDYKPQIIELVKDRTGRDLDIPGQIDLSVFPWLGVKLGKVELSNAKGFGKKPFAKINAVDVRVQLLPLLKKDIQVGHIELDGLQLDLQRDANGNTNWDDLIKPRKKPVTPKTKTGNGVQLAGLAVGGVSIRNAYVSWNDRQNNQSIAIESFNLDTESISGDRPVAIKLDTHFVGKKPDISGQLKFKTTASVKTKQQLFTFNNLQLSSQLQSPDLFTKNLDIKLTSDKLVLNQDKQTLHTKNLQLTSMGLKLYASGQVTQLNKQPRYQLSITSDAFSFKSFAQQVGLSLPPTADKSALTNIKLSSKLTGGMNNVSIKPLSIQLDDSSLNGHVHVTSFKQPALSYKLTVDNIDADRYLPQADRGSAKKPATPATAATSSSTIVPVNLLRRLQLAGDLKINALKLKNARSKNINITSNVKNGVLRLYPLTAQMYEGNYKGNVQVDVRGKSPHYSMNESLSNINIGPLLKDVWGDDKIQGKANLNAKLTARGNDPMSIRKTLNGNASFRFENGMVKGINIAASLRKLEAKLKLLPAPKETGPEQTDFTEMKGTVQVKNGIATNNDFTAASPYIRVHGKGSANLVNETLDYTVYVKYASTAKGQGGISYAQIDKTPLPVKIKGPFSKPSISVDYEYVLKSLAEEKIEKKKTEAKEKLQKKLEEKLKIDEKLKDILKF